LAFDVVNSIEDLGSDPQVVANDYIVNFDHEILGPVRLVGHPVSFSETPARIQRRAPQFGEHTEEVLLEVGGYTWEDIAQLREEGVI
jgi:crotonobetainyl-CoA:carnitine CoA-transferase CaiB-like acyl-CoA transferase